MSNLKRQLWKKLSLPVLSPSQLIVQLIYYNSFIRNLFSYSNLVQYNSKCALHMLNQQFLMPFSNPFVYLTSDNVISVGRSSKCVLIKQFSKFYCSRIVSKLYLVHINWKYLSDNVDKYSILCYINKLWRCIQRCVFDHICLFERHLPGGHTMWDKCI